MGKITRYFGNEDGSVMPIFMISMVAILTLVGATIALNVDTRAANNLQYTADAAAVGGATAFITTPSPKLEDRLAAAKQQATSLAIENTGHVLSDFELGAISEDPYGQKLQIEVEIEFEPANAAAKMAGRNANVAMRRRAKAEATWGFPLCTLSLAKKGAGLTLSDEAELTAKNCLIWSNTPGGDSMRLTGGRMESKYSCAHGRVSRAAGAHVSPQPSTDCRKIPDPLAYWEPPVPGVIEIVDELAVPEDAEPEDNTQPFVQQVEKLLKDAGEIDRFVQYAFELQQIGGQGLDAASTPLESLTHDSLRSTTQQATLDRDQLDDVTGPAADNDWSHPRLNIDQGGQTDLRDDGTLRRGPGRGLTLMELARAAGLLDQSEEEPIENDRYFDQPTLTLSPGTYGGLYIFEGHVRLDPGIYHIVNAPLIVKRRATLSGTDVTIILHGDAATFQVLDEARLDLKAPRSGITAGFAIGQNRKSISEGYFGTSKLAGDGRASLIGTVYLPKQNFAISGRGSGQQASPLLQIVANEVQMRESGQLMIDFDETKTDVPVVILPERTARLIE